MNTKKYIAGGTLLFGLALLMAVLPTSAQTASSVVLTWRAGSFFPSDYAGKTIPSPGAPVSVAALILKNGKVLDSRTAEFTWYLDERFMAKGAAMSRFSFTATRPSNGYHFVRVEVAIDEETFLGSVRIPTASPKVAIDAPFRSGVAAGNAEITISAIPFFFNVRSIDQLGFTWVVNGERYEGGSQNHLTLNVGEVPAGTSPTINAEVFVKNLSDTGEYAKGTAVIQTNAIAP